MTTPNASEKIAGLALEISQDLEGHPAGTKLVKLMELLENTPVRDVGVHTNLGGTADPSHKSFADFLLAIKRNDQRRLRTIYRAQRSSTKDIQSQDGPAGGYLVPEEYHARLMQLAADVGKAQARCTVIPVKTDAGKMPTLNIFDAPSAGQGDSAFAGGLTVEEVAPGGTLTESQPTFEQIEYVIRKVGDYVLVENEVIADSPIAIENLVTMLFRRAVANKIEYYIFRGSGVGQPLGILNAAAAIGVTPATNNVFAYADALSMKSRLQSAGGNPAWFFHKGIWPDIGIFETTSGGGVFQANLQSSLGDGLLGHDLIESEHLPQDNSAGCVCLLDLAAYIIFDRSMEISYSEHFKFDQDKGAFRVTKRMDGQPWVAGTSTLADPQGGYTVSPYVYLND